MSLSLSMGKREERERNIEDDDACSSGCAPTANGRVKRRWKDKSQNDLTETRQGRKKDFAGCAASLPPTPLSLSLSLSLSLFLSLFKLLVVSALSPVSQGRLLISSDKKNGGREKSKSFPSFLFETRSSSFSFSHSLSPRSYCCRRC